MESIRGEKVFGVPVTACYGDAEHQLTPNEPFCHLSEMTVICAAGRI